MTGDDLGATAWLGPRTPITAAEGLLAIVPALGSCLGGNATIVGASANVVSANAAARAGHPISFGRFLRIGGLVALLSLAISSACIWVRYLL